MEELKKVSFTDFVDMCVFMRAGEYIRLSEFASFDDECTWCVQCIYDNFSGTNKLLISHNTQSDIYPSTLVDIPSPESIETWKIWFEHILRIKGLLNSDKYVFTNNEDVKKLLYCDYIPEVWYEPA